MPKTFNEVRIYQLLLIVTVLVLLWKWHCGGPAPCPTITETVRVDTFKITVKDSSGWSKPTPVFTKPGKVQGRPVETPTMPGQPPIIQYLPVDTMAILADYYTLRGYDSTYTFAEGDVQVQSMVQGNMIQTQRVLPTWKIDKIVETVTQSEKPRRQFYLGIEGYGGKDYPLYGAGASLLYKDRKNRMYEAGPVIFKDQPLMWKAGAKFLISFR